MKTRLESGPFEFNDLLNVFFALRFKTMTINSIQKLLDVHQVYFICMLIDKSVKK